MAPGRGHRFLGDLRRRRGETGEDAAGMKPPGAVASEDALPVHVAGLELTHRGVASVRAAHAAAQPEPPLGEVQAIAHGAADAVVGNPAHVGLVDAALVHQVLHQGAHGVLGQSGDDGGVEAEAPLEPASDVVLTAPLPCAEGPRGGDALLARIEAQHDLPQRHQVEAATFLALDGQIHDVILRGSKEVESARHPAEIPRGLPVHVFRRRVLKRPSHPDRRRHVEEDVGVGVARELRHVREEVDLRSP